MNLVQKWSEFKMFPQKFSNFIYKLYVEMFSEYLKKMCKPAIHILHNNNNKNLSYKQSPEQVLELIFL